VVGATAGLGWLLILTTPIAEPVAAQLPSREQLLFMLEFSDSQGEFVDPFEIQLAASGETADLEQSPSNESAAEGRNDDGHR